MMGVGKSTIGRKLAKKLKRKFIDIDKIIEIKEKNTIKEIFENKGEHYFRKIEKKITLEELKKNNLIIALGGGAFINTSIRREIKNSCLSFWLDLKVESLLIRLRNVKKRPLLDQDKLKQSINDTVFLSGIGKLIKKNGSGVILITFFVLCDVKKFNSINFKNFDFRLCIELPILVHKNNFSYSEISMFERKR